MTYSDRFNPSWQKILFRPDKKSQAAEFNELQSLVNHQYTKAFDYLFSGYRIVRGLQISLVTFIETGCIMKLSSGQVFIKQGNNGYFVEIPEHSFFVLYNQRTYVSINPIFTEVTDSNKDPLIGGELAGDLGADRLIVDSELSLNGDGFPIAVVQGLSTNQYPHIFYYKEEGYSLEYNNQYVTSLITDYLALRIYEESGDFIAEGLELAYSTNTISISAGKSYINGKLVILDYPTSFSIAKEENAVYSVYLTYYGSLHIEKTTPNNKPNTILIGVIERVNSKIQVMSTNSRPLLNSDIKLLQQRNLNNRADFLDILLSKSTVNQINLSGFFIDSFSNLNNSDITSINYSASIIPKYGLLRSSLISNTINATNLTELSNNLIDTVTKDGVPYYLTPVTSERIVLEQNRATGFISFKDTSTKASIIVNPPNGTPNKLTKEYQSLLDLEPFTTNLLDIKPFSNFSIQSTLESNLITLDGVGFRANEDNLRIVFGNIQITEFTILKGSAGSTNFTIKAAQDGLIKVNFRVPANLIYKQYTITVSNSNTSSSTLFRDKQSELLKFSYNSQLAQTFTIETPITLSKLNLALRTVPNLVNGTNIALVSIVKTINNLPTEEILGQGILTLNDVSTSPDATKWSTLTFSNPIPLGIGQYALLISPLISGQSVEFYYAEVGKRSLSSTSISDTQPLVGGELLIKEGNQWIRELSKDLTFQLVQAVPSTTYSEVVYKITNSLGNIHYLSRDIKTICPPLTKVDYYYKGVNGNWLPLNSSQPIEGNFNEVEIKLIMNGTNTMFPIVMLNQSTFTIYENRKTGTWVSKTIDYRKGYRNVEVELDYYKPIGTNISLLISSNAGETWQALSLDNNTVELINSNVPLYKGTWVVKDMQPTTVSTDINGNTSRILRTKLTIKVEFSSQSPEVVPYVMNLKSVVY